jgi:hypothetical protein
LRHPNELCGRRSPFGSGVTVRRSETCGAVTCGVSKYGASLRVYVMQGNTKLVAESQQPPDTGRGMQFRSLFGYFLDTHAYFHSPSPNLNQTTAGAFSPVLPKRPYQHSERRHSASCGLQFVLAVPPTAVALMSRFLLSD